MKELQRLCGFLNFICRCIVPGRAFTRRIYNYFDSSMKPHYHVNLNKEIKSDLSVWQVFLKHPSAFCRPFMDFTVILTAEDLDMYTDTSGKIGCGGIFNHEWFHMEWDQTFLKMRNPSIEYLELYAVTIAVLVWILKLQNRRICLFVDNESVQNMINATSTKCKNCMVLIRMIVTTGLIHNVRVFAKHVSTKDNFFADTISRNQWRHLAYLSVKHNKHMNLSLVQIPTQLRNMEDLWINV